MLATLIIVFREVIEAALIISIVAAATKGIAKRNLWLLAGIGAGIFGAVAVAGFAGTISSALEGVGQELFNASVLFLAVIMLGWHNVWMGRHGRELAAKITTVSHDVAVGTKPLYAVAIAVGVAVLREGSEVALFLYGIASGGTNTSSLLAGGAAGLIAGVLLGIALYKGLINLSTRKLFSVTSWMILLLAAGLAAQGAQYLVQAGLLPALGGAVWDSSWLLSDRTIFGKMLHTLIGYNARPTPIQILFYLTTLVSIGGLMRLTRPTTRSLGVTTAIIAGGLIVPTLVPEGAAYAANIKVYSPYVEKGEAEIEYQGYRTFDSASAKNNEQKNKLGLGYGVTDYWATEFYGIWKKSPGGSTHFDATEWENRFQLTERNAYFADLGFLIEYEHVRDRQNDVDELAFGPLLAKDIGRTTTTANFIFERQLGSRGASGVAFTYRLQERWRLYEAFEPAIEAYGNLGKLNNLDSPDRQEHMVGPAVQGAVRIPGWLPGKLKYNVGYLFGVTSATASGTLKSIVEYELRF
jgi:high-affinity iron transporter